MSFSLRSIFTRFLLLALLVTAMVLFLLAGATTPAYAAEATAFDNAISAFWLAVAGAATLLLRQFIAGIEKKRGVDIPDQLEYRMEQLAEQAVDFAEEQSHHLGKRVGEKVEAGLQGHEKLEAAIRFFQSRMRLLKLPELSETEVKEFVLAILARRRRDGGLVARLRKSN
jgi:membrane protein implicated in regulation of membrane protease activity